MPTPEQTTVEAAASEQTPSPTEQVDPAKYIDFDDAQTENTKRNFTLALLEARTPKPKPEYVPPAPSERVAAQTNAEMEAGRKLVGVAEANEAQRREITDTYQRDKRQNPGTTESVFRPNDYVPDQKKNQGNVTPRGPGPQTPPPSSS